MGKPYTHVIWDFNGTLVDDCWIAVAINCEMNKKRGKPEISMQNYRDTFVHPPKDFYLGMGYRFESESYEEVSGEFIGEYVRRQRTAALTKGVTEVLEILRKAGLSQLVISAHRETLLAAQIAQLQIGHYFKHIIGTEESAVTGKIERALCFAASEGIDFSHAVMVGDTDHDYETAKALGCDCLLYSGGHQSRWRLEALGAPVVGSIQEILPWILAGEEK